ncbi:lytic transglycosylase domain-containing protein [Vibrio crassostreae]|uniref:lytic transglycosylase domain-containing protein n=1 Tax=Vibrio crassostreae TaxID=246167 RepID=UPI001B30D54F
MHQVPREIAYLAAIESSFREDARSKAGAVGMWQFMPATARDMGLVVNNKVDERLDWKKSTVAAVKYIKWLAEGYFNNDYETAIIAYNYGVGNTRKLIKRVRSSHSLALIRSGQLPRESEEYLLKFLTYMHLYEHYKINGNELDETE